MDADRLNPRAASAANSEEASSTSTRGIQNIGSTQTPDHRPGEKRRLHIERVYGEQSYLE